MPVNLETEIVACPPFPLSPDLWLSVRGFFPCFFLVRVCLSCLMLQHHLCPGNPLEGQSGLTPSTSTLFDPSLGPHGLILLILRELAFQRLSISNLRATQSATHGFFSV